ncbi:hypothetical protein VTH06DRAFT_7576 [Thermothelomyces fergusii]
MTGDDLTIMHPENCPAYRSDAARESMTIYRYTGGGMTVDRMEVATKFCNCCLGVGAGDQVYVLTESLET